MPTRKVISISVASGVDGRFVVTKYSTGEMVREAVKKTKPTRKPRMRRQKLMNRTRQKQI